MQKNRPNLLPSDPSFAFQRKFVTPIKNLFQRQLGLNFFWRRLVFFASHFHSRKIACSAACACVSVRVRACVCVLGVCGCVCDVCAECVLGASRTHAMEHEKEGEIWQDNHLPEPVHQARIRLLMKDLKNEIYSASILVFILENIFSGPICSLLEMIHLQ